MRVPQFSAVYTQTIGTSAICLQSANLCEQRLPPKRNSFPFVYLGMSVAFVEKPIREQPLGPRCERKEAHRGGAAGPTPSEEGFQSGELWMG